MGRTSGALWQRAAAARITALVISAGGRPERFPIAVAAEMIEQDAADRAEGFAADPEMSDSEILVFLGRDRRRRGRAVSDRGARR